MCGKEVIGKKRYKKVIGSCITVKYLISYKEKENMLIQLILRNIYLFLNRIC